MSRTKRPLTAITDFVLHHSASNDERTTVAGLEAYAEKTGLGYHVRIDDDEAKQDPRKGHNGKTTWSQHVPDDEVANGAKGLNYNGLHFCIDGNFDINDPTSDEVETLVQVMAAKAKRLGWTKEYVLGNPSKGLRPHILTHQEVGRLYGASRYETSCPGKNLIALMPYIRSRVAAYLPV